MKGLHRICAALFVLCQACAAWGYVQNSTFGGNPLHRTDFADVRYVINDQSVAGLVNRDGMPIITSDSSPAAAIQAAMDNWTNVPSSEVRFAPLEVTAAANPSSNRTNLVTFADTDRTRSILGMAVGITLLFWDGDGALTDTDILFNPRHSYSTTLRPDTFDIQATMTHELGHALGLDHSGVAGASMFAVAARQSNTLAILSADDIAFVTTIYPRLGSLQDLGVIRGRVERTTGGLVRGALVAAVSPTTGVIVGGGLPTLSGTTRSAPYRRDGTSSMPNLSMAPWSRLGFPGPASAPTQPSVRASWATGLRPPRLFCSPGRPATLTSLSSLKRRR